MVLEKIEISKKSVFDADSFLAQIFQQPTLWTPKGRQNTSLLSSNLDYIRHFRPTIFKNMSKHMTFDKNNLSDLKKLDEPVDIVLGNGNVIFLSEIFVNLFLLNKN